MDQQEKLRATQHNIQDFVAENLRQLTREKMAIKSGHRELSKMMEDVRNKLGQCNFTIWFVVVESPPELRCMSWGV
jgi:hypothetical protein